MAVPLPSSTPIPEIALFVPDTWQELAANIIDELNGAESSRAWRLVNDRQQADIRLVNDSSGIMISETALALAVPFTSDWESVIYAQAEEILNEEHGTARVLPWPDLQPDEKALRIQGLGPADNDYPLQDTWSLSGDETFNEAIVELAPLLKDSQEDNVLHLAAVGDIMLDRMLGIMIAQGDTVYPFSAVADVLQEADISVGNVESALGDSGEPVEKRYPFRAPPEAAISLASAGFDVVSLANNHAMDYGPQALLQAIDLLQAQGIQSVGAGANSSAAHTPHITEVNGLTAAFFGYVHVQPEASTGFDTASWIATEDTPGVAWADPAQITADIQTVREKVDLVIVLLHSGYEYVSAPSEAQQAAAHAAVDAGADLVIGHHAHILQGIEYYKNGVIIYGTGNFAFDIDGPPETAVFHIWLDRDGVREVAIEPAIVQSGGKPRLARREEEVKIRRRVYHLSDILNPP